MPLFNIVGVTAIGTSFFVGFSFLDTEDIESFQWVLERVRELYYEMGMQWPTTIVSDCDAAFLAARQVIFPHTNHLLCVWHVFKNVLSHCKAEFKKDLAVRDPSLPADNVRARVTTTWEELLPDLQRVIYAKTVDDYETAWDTFRTKWSPKYPRIPTYIDDTWLSPYREMIVRAWTSRVLHFDNTATSRAERAHLVIKVAVRNSAGDLDQVVMHISAILRRQQEQYRAELSRQAASRPKKLLNPVFRLVLERVGHQAKPSIKPMRTYSACINCSRSIKKYIATTTFPLSWIHALTHVLNLWESHAFTKLRRDWTAALLCT
jgi:transposase-like protein